MNQIEILILSSQEVRGMQKNKALQDKTDFFIAALRQDFLGAQRCI